MPLAVLGQLLQRQPARRLKVVRGGGEPVTRLQGCVCICEPCDVMRILRRNEREALFWRVLMAS